MMQLRKMLTALTMAISLTGAGLAASPAAQAAPLDSGGDVHALNCSSNADQVALNAPFTGFFKVAMWRPDTCNGIYVQGDHIAYAVGTPRVFMRFRCYRDGSLFFDNTSIAAPANGTSRTQRFGIGNPGGVVNCYVFLIREDTGNNFAVVSTYLLP